jgi:undecaprenyl-diphosphatase
VVTPSRAGHAGRRHRWPIVLLLLLTIGAAATFVAFAGEVVELELQPLDRAGRSLALALSSALGDRVFGAITWIGSVAVVVPVSLFVAWYLWRRHSRTLVAPVVLAPIAAVILSDVLKAVFRGGRPAGAIGSLLGYGFPSGHTTGVTAAMLTMAYVLIREKLMPPIAMLVAVMVTLLVGFSRIYLDVHWVSDVIGGSVVGLLVATACAALYERARLHEPMKP